MHVSRIRAVFVVALVFAYGVWQQVNAAPPKDRADAPANRQAPNPPPSNLNEMLVKPITPSPEAPIPDDPPPHEGALLELPYVIEAPDIVIVELLEGLPGRPIKGEHIVRQDGTIGLGFYGDVHVQGLTMRQVKVKIIQHLRSILSDEVLGLIRVVGQEEDGQADEERMAPPEAGLPPLPRADDRLFDLKEESNRRSDLKAGKGSAARTRRRSALYHASHRPGVAAAAKRSIRLAHERLAVEECADGPGAIPMPAEGVPGERQVVVSAPEDSLTLYVDMGSYNSKFYFVQGDVAVPGRFPWTGRETVLDAMQVTGGLIPTGDPRNIRLVRPARGGKKAHVYPIDLQAIVEKGDKTANLQVFPGDRLVIGRDPVVKTTIAIDRAAAPIQSVLTSIRLASVVERSLFPPNPRTVARLQIGGLTWTLEATGEEKGVTPAQREETVKAWVEFWSKVAARAGGADGDDALLREALRRHLMPVAPVAPRNGK